MKKFPIGIQNFRKMREGNYYYVDKTQFVHKLATEGGGYYFLSRPRRFGKSLFLDTLNEAFCGNKELFNGLFIEDKWDWDKKFPVINISFGTGVIQNREELDLKIRELLDWQGKHFQIENKYKSIPGQFSHLIESLYKKYTSVVILIDEYDKPILDNITNIEIALEIREGLKSFYSVIKDADKYLKFVFLTGVSKFSRVSLFSGLNNLQDLTLDHRYSDICGYTHMDLLHVFEERLHGVDVEEIRTWYNGYSWLGDDKVYNPYDVLLYLDTKEFRNFRFETGTPSFLIKLLQDRHYYIPELENLEVGEELIGSFDVDRIEPETLLFQAGYLTIKEKIELGAETIYALTYPNLEVKKSLTDYILAYLVEHGSRKSKNKISIFRALDNADLDDLKVVFSAFFSSIPHDWYRKNELAGYEGYYASIFYCYFTGIVEK